MKKCNKCNIKFNTTETICPLCQNKLEKESIDKVFPTNIRLKTNAIILKCLLFISLAISIIAGAIELYISNNLYYCLFIIGGLFTNYVFLYFILKNKENVLNFFGKCGVVLILLSLIWYIATKNTIITNFIIPSICIFELLFNLITFIVLKRNYVVNYFNLIILNVLLLIVPLILILLNCTTFNLLSYICFILDIIVLIGLVIFYFDDIKTELNKLFNI